jgi:hypothetical protein
MSLTMEKIYFDDETYIWKTKLNYTTYKTELLTESNFIIQSFPNNVCDSYPFKRVWLDNTDFIGNIDIKTKIDEIVQIGINSCKKLYSETNVKYNKLNISAWINRFRSVNPIQPILNKNQYHVHTEINKKNNSFIPYYTFVYYIQMPDVMKNQDGVLYLKSTNNTEHFIRPDEDDLIIMNADTPHKINNAPFATFDRIVIAGNVGFEYL